MATVYDKSSLFLAPSGVSNGTVFTQKPVPIYGPELVTNGDFATDSDWTKGSGWTISGGKATKSGSDLAYLTQSSLVSVVGKTYKVKASITNVTAGNVRIDGFTAGGTITSDTEVNVIYTATAANPLRVLGWNGFNGSIDNISVQEVLTDGADFTFSRGSNLSATRVNADGLIEKGRENLLLQSNSFDTTWTNSSSTETGGQSGYDGSNDAWLITKSSSHGRIQQNISASGVQCVSVYAKAATSTWLRLVANTASFQGGFFDLSNGVTGSVENAIHTEIEDIGSGWYRCSVIFNGSTTRVRIYPAEANSTTATSGSIYIQDAQLESGLATTDYIETTATTGKAGLLENTPRLDYSGGSTCPSLLLEPQRTNFVPNSEYFGLGWSLLSGGSFSFNQTTSPEGLQNASLLSGNGVNSNAAYFVTSVTSGSSYSFSLFAKANGQNLLRMRGFSVAAGGNAIFDLSDGTIDTAPTDDFSNAKIEAIGEDGWYRCSVTATADATDSNALFGFDYSDNSASGGLFYIYGAQLEAGSYPTSYIPTYGTSQTRSGDDSQTKNYDYSTSNNYTLFFDFNLDNQPLQQNINSKDIRASSIHIMSWRWFNKNGKHCFVPYFNNDGVYPFSTNVEENITDNGKVVMSVSGGTYKLFLRSDGTTTMRTTTGKTAGQFNRFAAVMDAKERINQIVFFDETLSDTDCEILTGATTYETFEEMALALNYTVYE